MIRSMVHDFPSIDDYNQVAISCFATLEVGSPLFSRSSISRYLRASDRLSKLFLRSTTVIKSGFRISRLWESPYFRSPDI
jgi:hypothetical protein